MRKVVLVTGASRGIGNAIFKQFLTPEYHVIGTATGESGCNLIRELMNTLPNASGEAALLNLQETQSIEALFTHLQNTCGTPDILINNAGITQDDLLMRMNEAQWMSVIETNLTSVYRLSKACVRSMMKKRWGRIISIGSVVGSRGNPGQTNYCAAKAGLVGFSKALAQEIGSRNITVNVVSPGFIQTDMTDKLSEEQKTTLIQHIPLGCIGQAADIANAVYFLASDQARYITGETLHVNGGLYMH